MHLFQRFQIAGIIEKKEQTRYIIRWENEYEMSKKWVQNEQYHGQFDPLNAYLWVQRPQMSVEWAYKAKVEIINWKCKKKCEK